jgi:hypothetical protein
MKSTRRPVHGRILQREGYELRRMDTQFGRLLGGTRALKTLTVRYMFRPDYYSKEYCLWLQRLHQRIAIPFLQPERPRLAVCAHTLRISEVDGRLERMGVFFFSPILPAIATTKCNKRHRIIPETLLCLALPGVAELSDRQV